MSGIEDPARIPHPEQVKNRMAKGWDRKTAETTPIRKVTKKDGSPNVAEFARAAEKAPSEVQRLVRSGLTIEDAVSRART